MVLVKARHLLYTQHLTFKEIDKHNRMELAQEFCDSPQSRLVSY